MIYWKQSSLILLWGPFWLYVIKLSTDVVCQKTTCLVKRCSDLNIFGVLESVRVGHQFLLCTLFVANIEHHGYLPLRSLLDPNDRLDSCQGIFSIFLHSSHVSQKDYIGRFVILKYSLYFFFPEPVAKLLCWIKHYQNCWLTEASDAFINFLGLLALGFVDPDNEVADCLWVLFGW